MCWYFLLHDTFFILMGLNKYRYVKIIISTGWMYFIFFILNTEVLKHVRFIFEQYVFPYFRFDQDNTLLMVLFVQSKELFIF